MDTDHNNKLNFGEMKDYLKGILSILANRFAPEVIYLQILMDEEK